MYACAAQEGTWAGHLELQAASLMLRCNLVIHQAGQPAWTISNCPSHAVTATLHLSYHNGEHWNSVRLADDFGSGAAAPIPVTPHGVAASSKQQNAWGRDQVVVV